MKRLVVLASGSGSNFQAILNAIDHGDIPAVCVGLISDRPQIGAMERAANAGIPVFVIARSQFDEISAYNTALLAQIDALNPDLIVLAGYLKKIPEAVVKQWSGKIINIHPSLLPKYGGKGFHGIHVHEAVIAAGDTESGCTVHFVDETYDTGSVIEQARVPVLPDDTAESLQQKILIQEHLLLPKVIRKLLQSSYSRS